MKSIETLAVNIFNSNVRKIKCIENTHDYLGTGIVFCEDNLDQGKIYTFIGGEMKPYGAMVFLKEIPNQYGFQAYLFEEIEPYNKQITMDVYEKWLERELEKAEEKAAEGNFYTLEEVEEQLDRILL